MTPHMDCESIEYSATFNFNYAYSFFHTCQFTY